MGGVKGAKKCSVCDYSHKLSSQVRRHERQAHGEHALECTVGCGLRVAYNRMARHIREHHPEAVFTVDSSGVSEQHLVDELTLLEQKHKRTHQKQEELKKELTDKENNAASSVPTSFSSSTVGILSIASQAVCQYQCHHCGQPKPNREALRKHIARVHEKRYREVKRRAKVHHCEWEACGKSFTTAGRLSDHMNTHNGKRPFSCDHCRREFIARAEFVRHLRKYHATSIRQVNRQIDRLIEMEAN